MAENAFPPRKTACPRDPSTARTESSIPTKTISQKDPNTIYTERSAVRAVLYDPNTKNVAFLYVAKGNYYKLPGGGVEAEENHQVAVAREILEETGCKAVIKDEDVIKGGSVLAKSEEWRNDLHQVSFCYIARLTEDTGKPELTDLERSEGLSHHWVPVKEALKLMAEVQPTSVLGSYIKERDLFFIEAFAEFETQLEVMGHVWFRNTIW